MDISKIHIPPILKTDPVFANAVTSYRAVTSYPYNFHSVCSICGHTNWVSASNEYLNENKEPMPEGMYFNFLQPHENCERCIDISQRNPELVSWIKSVFGFQEYLNELTKTKGEV